MSSYGRHSDETIYISFLIRNDKLQGNSNKIWEKASNIKKRFDNEPVQNKKCLRTNDEENSAEEIF